MKNTIYYPRMCLTDEQKQKHFGIDELELTPHYESPIKVIQEKMATHISQSVDAQIYQACINVGINVDEKELRKALEYDRDQYMKGYKDGFGDALGKSNIIRLPLEVGEIVYARHCINSIGLCQYKITNIIISQNKKGEWTKKYRAMRMVDGKTIDDQLNFDFDEIGKSVFASID